MPELQIVIFPRSISIYYEFEDYHNTIIKLLEYLSSYDVKLVDKVVYNLIDVHCKDTGVLYDCLFVLSVEFTLIVS